VLSLRKHIKHIRSFLVSPSHTFETANIVPGCDIYHKIYFALRRLLCNNVYNLFSGARR
jgi:hypothetical protein